MNQPPRDKIGPGLEAAKDLEPRPRGNRKPCTFSQTALARGLRAAKAAGLPVREAVFDPADGKLHIYFGEPVAPAAPEPAAEPVNPWLKRARERP